jgi:hypothetical protein
MPKVTIAPLVLRTTSDQAGHVHGLAIGAGATLDSALEELETEAQRQAGELARELQPDDAQPDAEWRFEVLDVRITTGPPGCAPDEAWVAYGTLTSAGRTPWAASYWDGPNGR